MSPLQNGTLSLHTPPLFLSLSLSHYIFTPFPYLMYTYLLVHRKRGEEGKEGEGGRERERGGGGKEEESK
jgi:hypothetical protein